jgi:hypothetical protein
MVKEVNGQKFTWGALGRAAVELQPHLRTTGGTLSPPSAKLYPAEDIFWLAFSFFGRERLS